MHIFRYRDSTYCEHISCLNRIYSLQVLQQLSPFQPNQIFFKDAIIPSHYEIRFIISRKKQKWIQVQALTYSVSIASFSICLRSSSILSIITINSFNLLTSYVSNNNIHIMSESYFYIQQSFWVRPVKRRTHLFLFFLLLLQRIFFQN
jgi:hypothetical protein